MAANRMVLYFEKQEDAPFFTLAASSVMSAEPPATGNTQLARLLLRFRKPAELLQRAF